jgi:two-component system chemotaxis sensor kinase CheA
LERLAMPLSRVARLEKIAQSRVEYAAGRTVLQYRGGILPLVSLSDLFGGPATSDGETLSVIVCRAGVSDVGLVVDEISDVTDESIRHLSGGGRHGILGSAVVGGRVTDFLDLAVVLQDVALTSTESLDRLRSAVSGHYEALAEEAVR